MKGMIDAVAACCLTSEQLSGFAIHHAVWCPCDSEIYFLINNEKPH